MIRYRKSQKIFFLGTATSLLFAGSSIAGLAQGKKGNELMAQQNAEMERANREQQKIEQQRLEQEKNWQEQQLKLQKKALKQGVNPFGDSSILNNTTGTPTTPLQPPPPIAQGNFSKNDIEEKQKDFSVFSFARDMSLLAARNKGVFIKGILAGASTTAGLAVADKAIKKDKQMRELSAKERENEEEERHYSKTRISLRGPVFSFALGAAVPAISYAAERKAESDMIQDTQREREEESDDHHKQLITKYKEKSYSIPLNGVGKILNAVSIMAGGGGAKGMRKLGIQIAAIGKKSGNKATKKLGKAILDNPNAAMALSIPGGLAVLGGTFSLGDKVATKIAKKIDPDAFSYIESKKEEVKNDD